MPRIAKPKVVGYADFETEHIGDLEARGEIVNISGNVVVNQNSEIPRVGIKCAGLIVRAGGEVREHMFHTIQEFLQGLADERVDIVYFHNMRFDDSFIASWMRNDEHELDGWVVKSRGRLISNRGVVYSDVLEFKSTGYENGRHKKTVRTCKILDSMKIWASSLDKLGKTFGVAKGGTTGGSKALEVGCSAEMEEYCLQDCRVLMTAMEFYMNKCSELTDGKKPFGWMTAGSTAYELCMMHVKDTLTTKQFREAFPACDAQHGFPDWMREGYKGAVPLLDKKKRNRKLWDVKVFDINSMYPDKLKNSSLPIGYPVKIRNPTIDRLIELKEEGKLWVAKVQMVMSVKKGHRGTFVLKRRNEENETLASNVDDLTTGGYQVITSVDLDYILRDYDVMHIEVLDALGFKADETHCLAPFVEYWYEIKEEASKKGDAAMKAFAKLLLNSLYGKFGTNPEHISAEYTFTDDMIRVKETEGVDVDKIPKYLPIAMFTTAYARDCISKVCNAVGWNHVVYTDTDSIHVWGLSNEECAKRINDAGYKIHDTEIGAFKYESRWREALYVRNKGYFHFGELNPSDGMPKYDKKGNEINEIKMAGANAFDWKCMGDVFNVELYAKQKRAYRVRGGTLIMMKDVAVDTRIDASIKTVRKIKGMNMTQSAEYLKRTEDALWGEIA